MEQKNMTALVSAFARAYHFENNDIRIFDDSVAKTLLAETYDEIAAYMAHGIHFFAPGFSGNECEALRWIVDHQLSPTPLGRAAFAEKALENAVRIGAQQYLIFAAGYDTFAYRQPNWAEPLQIFEIDYPETSKDKLAKLDIAGIFRPQNTHYIPADLTDSAWQHKLQSSAYSAEKRSFCSMLGMAYYFSKEVFCSIIGALGKILASYSSIVFDYPNDIDSSRGAKQAALAQGANESMLARYSYFEIEQMLADRGFLVYEHLTPAEMTAQYFSIYNRANPAHQMEAFENVCYCLAVKRP